MKHNFFSIQIVALENQIEFNRLLFFKVASV